MDIEANNINGFDSEDSGRVLFESALVASLAGLSAIPSPMMPSTDFDTVFTSIGTTLTTNV